MRFCRFPRVLPHPSGYGRSSPAGFIKQSPFRVLNAWLRTVGPTNGTLTAVVHVGLGVAQETIALGGISASKRTDRSDRFCRAEPHQPARARARGARRGRPRASGDAE